MDITVVIDNLASTATFVGAVLVFLQLRIGDRQEAQSLVADYNARYMGIARDIPLGVFTKDLSLAELGVDPSDSSNDFMRAIYEYMLLCEEQANFARSRIRNDVLLENPAGLSMRSRLTAVFRLRNDRVWAEAWAEWRDGMISNMKRRAFRDGAERVIADLQSAGLGDDFAFVRRLLDGSAATPPR